VHDIRKNKRLDVFKTYLLKGAQFSSRYEFPMPEKVDYKPAEAIPFNAAKRSRLYQRWVHFYLYDYIFECVWNLPKRYLPLFSKFQNVITPDFSLYRNLPLAQQIWNTFRSRAIGYWLQSKGLKVITNVRWGDERTYSFAFEGLPKGGTYAVSTNGCIRDKKNRYYYVFA